MSYLATGNNFQVNQVPVMWVYLDNQTTSINPPPEPKESIDYQELLLENQKLRDHIERLSVIYGSFRENVVVDTRSKNVGRSNS